MFTKTVGRLGALLFCIFTSAVFSPPALAGLSDCADIATDKGAVTGVLNSENGVCVYKGIPYAAPPVGDLRFRLPQPSEPWKETLQANEYGGTCVQPAMEILSKKGGVIGGEDCLYLNVWQPTAAAAAPMPVMVFIHGGGFIYGSGGAKDETGIDLSDGTFLSTLGGVIVVTINYRLGIFGFMVHPALKDEEGRIGNYGLYDQLAALQWVKTNVAAFGGDPDNVTIFGESAGGMSVGLQLASPLSRGLFKQAVIESGPVLMVNKNEERAGKTGLAAAALAGCGDAKTAAKCLRDMPMEKFMSEIRPVMFMLEEQNDRKLPFEPIIDGHFIPERPFTLFAGGKFPTDVKVMLGTNRDEAAYFTGIFELDTKEDFYKAIDIAKTAVEEVVGVDVSTDIAGLYPPDAYRTPRIAFMDLLCDVAFTCPTRVMANLMADNGAKVYLYYLTKGPVEKGPLAAWGAFHGADLLYIFRRFEFMGIKLASKENMILSDRMIELWSSFAHGGVPTAKGAPEWPLYESGNEPYLRLDTEITTGTKLKSDKCMIYENMMKDVFGN